MKIAIIVEGKTGIAFLPHLRRYLRQRCPTGAMPTLDPLPYDHLIPTGEKLQRIVSRLLVAGPSPADHVIALTDVYTGTAMFVDGADAKRKMLQWVPNEPRFHPHAAQHDFEAWLLPYWPTIQRLAGHNKAAPGGNPENVNHDHPPAHRIKEVFRIGSCRDSYVKPRDANKILRDNDLSVAISQCGELRALVNTILSACGVDVVP